MGQTTLPLILHCNLVRAIWARLYAREEVHAILDARMLLRQIIDVPLDAKASVWCHCCRSRMSALTQA